LAHTIRGRLKFEGLSKERGSGVYEQKPASPRMDTPPMKIGEEVIVTGVDQFIVEVEKRRITKC
jgi:hypothetical protein